VGLASAVPETFDMSTLSDEIIVWACNAVLNGK
jgi:hypothetical protein